MNIDPKKQEENDVDVDVDDDVDTTNAKRFLFHTKSTSGFSLPSNNTLSVPILRFAVSCYYRTQRNSEMRFHCVFWRTKNKKTKK